MLKKDRSPLAFVRLAMLIFILGAPPALIEAGLPPWNNLIEQTNRFGWFEIPIVIAYSTWGFFMLFGFFRFHETFMKPWIFILIFFLSLAAAGTFSWACLS